MRRIAADGGASTSYPLSSTARLHLSSADFTFGQRRSRRLLTSTRQVGGGKRRKNRLQGAGWSLSKHGGADAAARRCCIASTRSALRRSPQPCTAHLPTPHPTWHRVRGLPPSRLRTPGSPRDRGASLTLSSSIPARIPRSFTGLTTCAAVWQLVRALRRLSVSSWASWPAAPRQHACPMVRASLPPPSMQPQDHSWPLFRTSPHT